jgi:hypothetical protein
MDRGSGTPSPVDNRGTIPGSQRRGLNRLLLASSFRRTLHSEATNESWRCGFEKLEQGATLICIHSDATQIPFPLAGLALDEVAILRLINHEAVAGLGWRVSCAMAQRTVHIGSGFRLYTEHSAVTNAFKFCKSLLEVGCLNQYGVPQDDILSFMIEQDFFKGKHRGWQNTLPEKWVGIALDLLNVAPEECMGLKEVVFSLVRKRSRQSNIAWSCLPGKRSVEHGKSRNKVEGLE